LPCYFESGDNSAALWKARFAPAEAGKYSYTLFNSLTDFTNGGKALLINNIELNARKEMILIATGNQK